MNEYDDDDILNRDDPYKQGWKPAVNVGGTESARSAEKFFWSPKKLSFGGTNVHQCLVNKQIFFN